MTRRRSPEREARRLSTGLLSFARSVQPGEGLFWGTCEADGTRRPIAVLERGVRGQSGEANAKNPGRSNPQVLETALVPPGCDGIELTFGLWVSDRSARPWACDDPEVARDCSDLVRAYGEKGGFGVLARGIAWNLANARFAWRNRFLADRMRVEIACAEEAPLVFDPARLSLAPPAAGRLPEVADLEAAVLEGLPGAAARLVARIEAGLRAGPRFLEVSWRAAMPAGQEVFPSQEYLRESRRAEAPSRVYAKLETRHEGRLVRQASLHAQKIGAALRHIDVWHGAPGYGAVPVNPYGGVQETGAVLRGKGKGSAANFYDLRRDAEAIFGQIARADGAGEIPGEVHFLVANLVRGGVFGEKP